MPEPAWVADAVWWHVYPLGFAGADASGGDRSDTGGLRRLVDWLDYAVALGANGIALGPIFRSGTHGYDTIDHLHIDERLGTDDDFDALVAAARRRGMRIMLDGVFNHVGRGFPRLADEPGWFRRDPADDGRFAVFEGHDGLVALDHSHPAVVEYVRRVMIHWLDRGADAWRLDAAYAVPERFWSEVLPPVRTAHPDAYFVGEVIHGDYAGIVERSGLDAVTQYELWKAIWSSLVDRNLFELSAALDRHDGFLETFVPQTFVGNHDVTRLATRLDDEWLIPLALVVLFTVGGTPSVYYGDEQAFRGVKEDRVGGDDEIRPAFPDSPDGLAPFGAPVLRLHQELIGLRRRHPWLHRARTEVLEIANERILYRSAAGERRLTIALNLADEPWPIRGGDDVRVPPRGWLVR